MCIETRKLLSIGALTILVLALGTALARSLRIVSSEVARLKYLRDFMERYAASIRVGESAEKFIKVELRNYMNVYEYSYQRIMTL